MIRKLQKKEGKFQHSSFLAWGATSAAGRLFVENGTLKVCNAYAGNNFYIQYYVSSNILKPSELCCWHAMWPHSGHYRPTEENFQEFKSSLMDDLVDLIDV